MLNVHKFIRDPYYPISLEYNSRGEHLELFLLMLS